MQIHRLFEIVYLLMERKTMTAKQLAGHFEVSVRTVLRDIDVLCSAGIPLYTVRGKGGGIRLMDGYVLNKAMFSKDEQTGILTALQQMAATQYPQTQAILSKLQGVFLRQTTDWLEVDFTHWSSGAEDRKKLETLQAALFAKQAVRITYSNTRGETSQRVIYPLKLHFKAMAWYVSAFCTVRQDYRVFKLCRLQNPEPVDTYFGDMDLAAPPLHIAPGAPPVPVTLCLRPRQAHRVYDEFCASQISRQANGSFLVRAALPDEPWLYSYLLTFGQDLEVLHPPAIRRALAGLAEAVLAKYTKHDGQLSPSALYDTHSNTEG